MLQVNFFGHNSRLAESLGVDSLHLVSKVTSLVTLVSYVA